MEDYLLRNLRLDPDRLKKMDPDVIDALWEKVWIQKSAFAGGCGSAPFKGKSHE
jgi:hypothetical protein